MNCSLQCVVLAFMYADGPPEQRLYDVIEIVLHSSPPLRFSVVAVNATLVPPRRLVHCDVSVYSLKAALRRPSLQPAMASPLSVSALSDFPTKLPGHDVH